MGLECDMSSIMQRFEEMEKKAQKDLSKKALDKGSDIILQSQKETVPKDTGALEESLEKGNFKSGNNASVEIGINGDEDVVRYGFYMEYGTENMVGKKWMKRAWNDSVNDAAEAIKESLKEDLRL